MPVDMNLQKARRGELLLKSQSDTFEQPTTAARRIQTERFARRSSRFPASPASSVASAKCSCGCVKSALRLGPSSYGAEELAMTWKPPVYNGTISSPIRSTAVLMSLDARRRSRGSNRAVSATSWAFGYRRNNGKSSSRLIMKDTFSRMRTKPVNVRSLTTPP